ncbi:MAG: hypothetical protein ACP5PO_08940 [Desulfurella sp.]|uniref:hypothetical protein n=1 Tax=Desulfurella sp. TaxID=1962857 RepID=UPI003D0FD646
MKKTLEKNSFSENKPMGKSSFLNLNSFAIIKKISPKTPILIARLSAAIDILTKTANNTVLIKINL